jgi:hypothetical protein
MRRIVRQLGIVATALIACVGVMSVAAPVAEAKTVATGDWAKAFCNAVKDWQVKVVKAHSLVDDVVTNGVSSSSAAKASQKRVVSALGSAGKASTEAAKSLKTVGAPDISGGAKIATTISTAVGDTAEVFTDAKDAVGKASTEPKKYQSKLKSISAQVDKDYAKAGKDIDSIEALDKGGVLDDALNAEPTCSFAGSS